MAPWANLLGYQAAWFAAVWSAGAGQAWIGMLACIAFVAWQLLASRVRAADARVLLAALGCGVLIESAAAGSGWLRHASPLAGWPAPPWILLLWGAFAMTLNHSMACFARRPWLAALFAAIGGPLAYLGAARGFSAVVFAAPAWHGALLLGAAWALALPFLLRIASLPASGHEVRA